MCSRKIGELPRLVARLEAKLLFRRRIIPAATSRRIASAARPKRIIGVSEITICHD